MQNVSITEVQTLSAINVRIIIAKSYACAGLDGVGYADSRLLVEIHTPMYTIAVYVI